MKTEDYAYAVRINFGQPMVRFLVHMRDIRKKSIDELVREAVRAYYKEEFTDFAVDCYLFDRTKE